MAKQHQQPHANEHAARHGGVTWLSFFVVGLVPLLPFLVPGRSLSTAIVASVILTLLTQFFMGALRSRVTHRGWLRSGLEMLALGALAGLAAFAAGLAVRQLMDGNVA